MDFGFVLDGSGSVGPENWLLITQFVASFAQHITFGEGSARVGVISFGNDASIDIGLNNFTSASEFVMAVTSLPYKDENTNTASGIRAMRTQLFVEENGNN